MKHYTIPTSEATFAITLTTVGWIDVFTRKVYKEILIDKLKSYQANEQVRIYGYVIMSNHIQLILGARGGSQLSAVLHDFKKWTTQAVIDRILVSKTGYQSTDLLEKMDFFKKGNGQLKGQYQLWGNSNQHSIELLTPALFEEKLTEIHAQPVKAGLVLKPEHYICSSAGNYAYGKGIIPVTLLESVVDRAYRVSA